MSEDAKTTGTKPAEANDNAVPLSRPLTAAAERALAEAEARRQAASPAPDRPREVHGRGGAEPVRFGDWEVKGLATDF